MQMTILNDHMQDMYIIDDYQSLIWTERSREPGDFELYTPINDRIWEIGKFVQMNLKEKKNVYVWSKDADTMMIIDTLKIETDLEAGNQILLS